MLKRPITYTDFNDDKVTEVFYFNLSETELIDLEVEHEGGFKAMIDRLIERNDRKTTVDFFKDLVLRCYGVKSDDGKHFEKSPELRARFGQSAAYPVLFMELATSDEEAAKFLTGVIPKSLAEEFEKAMIAEKTAAALGTTKDG